jgi:ubiquinone/menaquinone biosynthesis C-methylase UbiE
MGQTAEQSSLILRMLAEFPYLPSPLNVIDVALELANLGPDDVFADLGCGDGVVLTRTAERFAVFCMGFDIDRRLVKMPRVCKSRWAWAHGLFDRINYM